MEFIPAGELLGSTTRIRTVTLRGAPGLPDGPYSLVDCYCTELDCDCRKTMIQVRLDGRFVSLISFGWESAHYYTRWYGRELDEVTLAEMQGPSIDICSPELVPAHAMLALFHELCDDQYRQHLKSQYMRFKFALHKTTAQRILAEKRSSWVACGRNHPCPCGSGRKIKKCCGFIAKD